MAARTTIILGIEHAAPLGVEQDGRTHNHEPTGKHAAQQSKLVLLVLVLLLICAIILSFYKLLHLC